MSHDELVGLELAPYKFPIEAGKVAEFAAAVFADDPVHFDEAAAAVAGSSGLVTPPTFSAAGQHWLPQDGNSGLDLDMRRVLAAGAQWDYFAPVVAGDVLSVTGTVISVEHKIGRRGGMTLITRETRFVNQNGELAFTVRSTVIELDEAPADSRSPQEEGA